MPNHLVATLLTGAAAALLLLPGCQTDPTFNYDLSGERNEIDSLLARQVPNADVQVSVNRHGRHVEITLPTAPDSLAEMNPAAPPDTAVAMANAIARTLKRSYDDFGMVRTLEVGFSNDTALWTSSIKLDKEALQNLGS